jgi:hypothetical protein
MLAPVARQDEIKSPGLAEALRGLDAARTGHASTPLDSGFAVYPSSLTISIDGPPDLCQESTRYRLWLGGWFNFG